MTTYAETNSDTATHTIEIFRGPNPTAEGEDLAEFFAGTVQAADAIYTWLEDQGVTQDDPDVYALVVPAGDGHDNNAVAVLPIAPVADPAGELVAQQTTRNKGGRPRLTTGEDSALVSLRLPGAWLQELDRQAACLGSDRSKLIRALIEDHVTRGCALSRGPKGAKYVSDFQAIPWKKIGRGWECMAPNVDSAVGPMSWNELRVERETPHPHRRG